MNSSDDLTPNNNKTPLGVVLVENYQGKALACPGL